MVSWYYHNLPYLTFVLCENIMSYDYKLIDNIIGYSAPALHNKMFVMPIPLLMLIKY